MNGSTPRVFDIRPATISDADEIARLLTTLGHPTAGAATASRWRAWSDEGNSAVVAARPDGTLAGVVTLHDMLVLHRPARVGRITSLIVDTSERGQGVGRALVAAAEQSLVSAGCGLIEITSNDRRVDAHAFYEHLGYARTSIRLAKSL